MSPVTRDRWGHSVVALSPLRERRLLQMAAHTCGNHKQHYGEYCYLRYAGYTTWTLGTAFLTEEGWVRYHFLVKEGV